jgi:pyruvate formate lyase activating enzyme
MTTLKVHSIETFGTHEGPGIRLVLFLQGCNFKCVYCHNPDTQDLIGNSSIVSDEEILQLLEKQKPYFKDKGGLTVSGGEPTLQIDSLLALFQKVKKAGFNTALDTNGFIKNEKIQKLYELTDLLLLDIKHIDDNWHQKITGQSNLTVLENAALREKTEKPMWIRYVLVPGYSDQEDYLHQLGLHFKDYKQIKRVEILPYHTLGVYKYEKLGWDYKLKGTNPPTTESINKAKSIFEKYFANVCVR